MSDKLDFAILFDIYSPLLTDKQRDTLDLYCNEDLSLAEIAETAGTTRQAVMNCIRLTERNLNELEDKMRLAERSKQASDMLDRIDSLANDGKCDEITALTSKLRELI